MSPHPQNLIWIDLEMTGLNPLEEHIIEIATLVTDKDLMIIAEGPELVIHQPQGVIDGMDEWNRTHHGQSGLIARVLESSLQVEEAEAKTLAFLHQWVPQGVSPICGNSICQDRRFLAREMPRLEAYFHYRNLDVSTLKELTSRWAPELMAGFTKKGSHRALDDIGESIAELRYYRQHILKI